MALMHSRTFIISALALFALGFALRSVFFSSSMLPNTNSPSTRSASLDDGTLVGLLRDITQVIQQRGVQQRRAGPIQVELHGAEGLVKEVGELRKGLETLLTAHVQGAADNNAAAPAAAAGGTAPGGALKSGATTVAPAGEQTIQGPRKYIMNLGSSKCLDLFNDVCNFICSRATVLQAKSQMLWMDEDQHIVHVSGTCLTLTPAKIVRMQTCDPISSAQRWIPVHPETSRGPAGTSLRNEHSGECLDLDSAGVDVVTNPCDNRCNQRWLISFFADGGFSKIPNALAHRGPPIQPKDVRIMCWVLTQPSAHATLVRAINNTWGRECNDLLFVSTEDYPGVNMLVVDLGQAESRKTLWMKTQWAWTHVYEHYFDKADWFYKADDDTFPVMPYLREFAAQHDTNVPVHYGRELQYGGKMDLFNRFVSGGAGMLLSKAAVKRMGEEARKGPDHYAGPINAPADLMTSRTLTMYNIPAVDAHDSKGRHRFIVIGLDAEYKLRKATDPGSWLWPYANDTKEADECCDKKWLATHYVSEAQMYNLYNIMQLQCLPALSSFPYLDPPFTPS